jgi:DNA-binding NarL/FixJ family response regulator
MNMIDPIRLMLIEDALTVRQGLAALLATTLDMSVVGAERHSLTAVSLAQTLQPDVILLDAARKARVDIIPALKRACPQSRIIVLSTRGDADDLQYALQLGVQGYLLKDAILTDVVTAVREVCMGKTIFHPVLRQWLPQTV